MSSLIPRIAILGSCITRDLWPIRGGGAEQLLYISRTSLPSLLSAPVSGFRHQSQPPGGLHRGEHNALIADLEKTALERLVAFRPTDLIFDFIDERFDLLAVGDALATHSAELEASGYLAQGAFRGARSVPRLSDACDRLWLSALREFAGLVRATPLASARLILHSARWAVEVGDAEGVRTPLRDVAVLADRAVEIAPYNAQLEAYEAAFQAEMAPFQRVSAANHHLASADHRWGLSPFHYVPDYYVEIRRQLEALGLGPAFRSPAAAPNAPAA